MKFISLNEHNLKIRGTVKNQDINNGLLKSVKNLLAIYFANIFYMASGIRKPTYLHILENRPISLDFYLLIIFTFN